jgi:molybdate transport system substrate-binding protein
VRIPEAVVVADSAILQKGVARRAAVAVLGAWVLLLAAMPAVRAEVSAPDVVVFCDPTVSHAVQDLGAFWRGRTGIPVRVFPAPTKLLLEMTAHGVHVDMLILQGDKAMDDAVSRKLVKPETRFSAWRTRLVLARRAGQGTPAPDLATALAQNTHVAIVDPGVDPAGDESQAALEGAGVLPLPADKSLGVVGTPDADFLLASGDVGLALVYATDLAAEPGFALAAPVPDGSYPPITYSVAIVTNPISANAEQFRLFLRSTEAQQRLKALGLEVSP